MIFAIYRKARFRRTRAMSFRNLEGGSLKTFRAYKSFEKFGVKAVQTASSSSKDAKRKTNTQVARTLGLKGTTPYKLLNNHPHDTFSMRSDGG